MKKKILVLDAYTNGHEAALRFIRKMKWKRVEYEMIFCGSHEALLKRLTEGPAFAVVPVHNTIALEVTEVTHKIAELEEIGYVFDVISELQLQINHCLLAPQHVDTATQLERVISHEKAIQQCGKYLDSIGLTQEKRSKDESTGNAARHVSRLKSRINMGAIASKAAAKAYNLKILAEYIQDVPKNLTKFLLLENKAYIAPLTVGIIGYNGRFGQVLKRFFEGLGCKVIGSDRKIPTNLTNADVVKQADVVIFAIAIKRTVKAIRAVAKYSREDQLFMDITSVKQEAISAMLEGKAQVVGLHPMFAPEVAFEGQTIVVCAARLKMAKWKTWVVNMLGATLTKIKESNGVEHDTYMATVQVSPHLANLTNAILIMEMGISTEESLTFTSPFYRVMFSLMGRLLSQSADLYSSIMMQNPATVPMLTRRIKIEQRLLDIIKRKDRRAFHILFEKAKQHFGSNVTRDANELFLRLIAVTKTLSGKNTVTLEFTHKDDQPGLLEKVARVFRRRNVNLTGFNSVRLDDRHCQFTMSFGLARTSDEVQRALTEISKWKNPRVEVKD